MKASEPTSCERVNTAAPISRGLDLVDHVSEVCVQAYVPLHSLTLFALISSDKIEEWRLDVLLNENLHSRRCISSA